MSLVKNFLFPLHILQWL